MDVSKNYGPTLMHYKLQARIENPKSAGVLTAKPGMRLCIGREPNVALYLLVDESDGVIADAKFQVYGPAVLIGVLDTACEMLLRKNHAQAKRFTADLIDNSLPKEYYPLINLVLSAIENAALQCGDIPYIEVHESPPLSIEYEGIYPGFETMSKGQKIALIDEIVEKEIRPYVELDAGGVEVLDLVDNALHIAYSGSCTTCYSATGSTLSAIQQILRAKVHPDLQVIPKL